MSSLVTFVVLIIYPLGAWLSIWDFSSIVMATIVIVFFIVSIAERIETIILQNNPDNSSAINSMAWGIADIKKEHEYQNIDLLKKIAEMEEVTKEYITKLDTIEENIQENTEQLETTIMENIEVSSEQYEAVIRENTEQLETTIMEKIETSSEQYETAMKENIEQLETNIIEKDKTTSEQLNSVIKENREQLETTIVEKIESIDICTQSNSETIYVESKTTELDYTEPLEGIVEQFEVLTEKNEELYSMYEPIMMYVQDLTEHMEYGNLLSEQIRILMGKNTELISKNEELTQQVEQLLSYQRNN